MPKSASPEPAHTASGAMLPVAGLPQRELLTVNESAIPLIRDALGAGVHFKPLRLDLENGEWVLLATFEPGAEIQIHYHTGPAEVLTLKGKWNYKEHPEQPQTPGSYLYEPAGSIHTFVTPAENTEDTVIFVRVAGTNVNFNEDGSFHSVLDAVSIRYLTDALVAERGLAEPCYIGGGETDFTTTAKT